ncbi:MAG: EutP/PduV family microcompartment system protein [Candidatus Gastranaerophilales bacterium]|nr:EutP/PduV family microcompartment system protein [Candidatus Gastranaerophilales bacterium]
MRKLILMGRSEAGKTTLTQALRGEEIRYYKTQDVHHYDSVIDTPGEYAQSHRLGKALALYTYEADVVGILVAANEPYSLFPPNVTCQANRECIGIVTKIDLPNANIEQADRWLEIAGCKTIFHVNSLEGVGVGEILDYLKQDVEKIKISVL